MNTLNFFKYFIIKDLERKSRINHIVNNESWEYCGQMKFAIQVHILQRDDNLGVLYIDHAKSPFFVQPMQYLVKSVGWHLKKLPWKYSSQNVFQDVFGYQRATLNRWTLISFDFW